MSENKSNYFQYSTTSPDSLLRARPSTDHRSHRETGEQERERPSALSDADEPRPVVGDFERADRACRRTAAASRAPSRTAVASLLRGALVGRVAPPVAAAEPVGDSRDRDDRPVAALDGVAEHRPGVRAPVESLDDGLYLRGAHSVLTPGSSTAEVKRMGLPDGGGRARSTELPVTALRSYRTS